MKFLIGLLLSLFSLNIFANDFMEFGNEEYLAKESNWFIELGAKYYRWDLDIPPYNGVHHDIGNDEKVSLLGPELAFGAEIHLFAGLSFSLKGRGFYVSEITGELGKASEDFDYDLAKVDSDASMYGGEGAASFNYTFVTSLVEIQPFAEVAVGTAQSYNNIKYTFEGLSPSPTAEFYKAKLTEKFITRKLTLGFNVISKYGIYSYFKASAETLTLKERKLDYSWEDQSSSDSDSVDEKDLNKEISITTYAIGFGYLF